MLMQAVLISALYSALTLYMMAILLRAAAPWLEIDLHGGLLRWLPRITDPLLKLARRILPDMGPVDWSPIAAVVFIWIVRIVMTGA
jgi:YggT family protein